MGLSRAIVDRTDLSAESIAWLNALVREWHLLADTSFSDLVCWLPGVDDNVFWAAAQVRPKTGPTALQDDVVGWEIRYDCEHQVSNAYLSHEITETSDNQLDAGIPVDVWAIPVMRWGKCIAVVERHTNRMGVRAPGSLEDSYMEVADTLSNMLWHGEFPIDPPSDPTLSPKVGDGLLTVAPDGTITYASPNAVSAYRRMGSLGELEGEQWEEVLASLRGSEMETVGQSIHRELDGSSAVEFDVDNRAATIRIRIVPLTRDGDSFGALVLTRDSTQLRDAARQLVTKNATIREIHHRVKNNLQTVAALLRLQSRRLKAPEAKTALSDAMNRVTAIAVVHELLSQSFDDDVLFDEIADRILQIVGDVSASSGHVTARRDGSFGMVPARAATSLSLVINELCQNAVEHGFHSASGAVTVAPQRDGNQLIVDVLDAGTGLPHSFDLELAAGSSLGLSIVRTLVEDLHGSFELSDRVDEKGVRARVRLDFDSAGSGATQA